MSIVVRPTLPLVGQIVTLTVKYEGGPPPPNDVHVEVENDGTWQPITGYDRIPDGMNPLNGFDMPVPPTSNWRGPGVHKFRVRWTRNGENVGSETVNVTTASTEPLPKKEWSWREFLGRILGGAIGSAIGGAILNWWTGVWLLPCIATGLAGGALGSALGQFLVWLFDEPKIKWDLRSAFLFSLFFSLTFAMFFGLLAVDLEREALARGEVYNRVTIGVSLVAGFLSTILAGVLNNLRTESES